MSTPAGWYPNPDGSASQRWWDGAAWTQHVGAPAMPVPAPSVATAPPRAPAGTSAATLWAWLLVATPLLDILLGVLDHLLTPPEVSMSTSTSTLLDQVTPWTFISVLLAWAVSAVHIVFSWLDHRELVRRGVPRPFHWAWAFFILLSAPVYVIGRAVIVRRRTGHGLAPMWAYVAAWALLLLVSATITGVEFRDLTSSFDDTFPS